MNCFGFFIHFLFSFFVTVLVVHPRHDHPVTTVLTHSTLLWHDIAVLKVALNVNQINKQNLTNNFCTWNKIILLVHSNFATYNAQRIEVDTYVHTYIRKFTRNA